MDLLRQYNEEKGELEGLKSGQVVFEALVPGETWYGIEDEANKVQMPKKVEIRDAENGFSVVVDDPATTIAGGLSQPVPYGSPTPRGWGASSGIALIPSRWLRA